MLKKNYQWELWDKNGKKCRKVKKKEKYRGPEGMWLFPLYFSPIFPLFFFFFFFFFFLFTSPARKRLGQRMAVVSGWERPEKGAGWKEQAKTASFWPVFFYNKNRVQNGVVLGPEKKKLGLAASLQLDWRRKKKKKEERVPSRTVGGDLGDCLAPCAPKRRLREWASPPFRRGTGGWRRAVPSLGAPFRTML